MLNNITIGRYYHKNSLIHRMNPFAKVLCTFLYVLIVVLFKDLFFLVLLLAFVLLIALMSKIPLRIYFQAIWSLKYFILTLGLITFFFQEDLIEIIFPIFRLVLIVFYSSLLTLTTSPNQLAKGLEIFMKPLLIFKVPVKQISLSLVHAIRFIPMVLDTVNSIIKAQRSRYVNEEIVFSKKFHNVLKIVTPTFIKSFEKTEFISNSMSQRLYNLNQSRTYFDIPKITFFDIYFLTIHTIIFIAVLYRLLADTIVFGGL